MCIKSYAIIRVSHKYIFNLYIFAAHKVNAIAPPLTTERFQVINLQSVYFPSQYGIMIRIDNCYTCLLYTSTDGLLHESHEAYPGYTGRRLEKERRF